MSQTNNSYRIHVSPTGNDRHEGSESSPVRTPARAQELGRSLRTENPSAGLEVVLHDGTYRIEHTLQLDTMDAGPSTGPTVWRAAERARVEVTGGLSAEEWRPVTDPAVVQRLRPEARAHVLEFDLAGAGVSDFGDIDPRSGNRMEVYQNGRFLELARYPNEGYLQIAEVPQHGTEEFAGDKPHMRDGIPVGRHYGRFVAPDDRMAGWQPRSDLYVHGYWTWDWADSVDRIERFDPETREIFPAQPYHRYGYHKNQRFYYLNVLEELDTPGEWYADTDTGKLYLWPLNDGSADGNQPEHITVSITGVPLVSLRNTSDLTVSGIAFTCSRNSAIAMEGCTETHVDNCTFSNLGLHAVVCSSGKSVTIDGCGFSELASGGIVLDGGDRRTLEPGRCEATDNHIHHFAWRLKTYHYGIKLDGVGNRIACNEIHHAPHSAIGWSGNEHVIELNEVHHVVTETNDAGACYNGRDPSQQGTIIRHNYWHHIGGIAGHGTNAVYFDDALCGNTVAGNVFFRAGIPGKALMGAVFIHGGRYNRIENNVFIDCLQAYGESPWTQETWHKYSKIHGWHERLHVTVEIDEPPYTERYPWLRDIMEDTRPNTLAGNLVARCERFLGRGEQQLEDNVITDKLPEFAEVSTDSEESVLRILTEVIRYDAIPDFEPIPFGRIGLGSESANE